MDCHDIRALLPYLRRGSDQIDPTERAALQQHLEGCAECAAASHSDEIVDEALVAAMRTVPVPAGLTQRVLARVAADRPRPWISIAAAAAVVLIAIGTAFWLMRPLPQIDRNVVQVRLTDPDKVEEWYRQQGVKMVAWPRLDYRLLWTYDIVEVQGQRVPKLIFRDQSGQGALAQMLVLRKDQFDTSGLCSVTGDTPNRISVEEYEGFVYLFGTTETLDLFLNKDAN